MRMAGIDLHGKLQDVERPDGSGRAGALDGELALNLTAEMTEPAVVGAFVGAALAYDRKGKQHSNQCKHSRVTRGSTIRLSGARMSCYGPGESKIWYWGFGSTKACFLDIQPDSIWAETAMVRFFNGERRK